MAPDADAVARLLRARVGDAPVELAVAGSSMAGVIATGSTVVIEAADRPRRGEIWAFVEDDGRVVVHRVRELDGDLVIGRGAGNPLDDDPVARDRLVGRVSAATHGGQVRRFGAWDRRRSHVSFTLRRLLRRFRRSRSR
ncbi:MAG: S24/S26 family peptidase [Acidimicrobiales bacterium]|nr:S24/S26 family peptidase [Acidimicrobiales bacterium]